MNEIEFNRLIKRIKKDQRAFEKLYGFYFHRIVMYITVRYGKSIADDVAQAFFLKLLTIDIETKIDFPTSWVYKVCDNLAKTYLRTNPEYKELTEMEDASEFRDEYLYAKEGLDQLGKSDRKIVYMHLWEGYSLIEISMLLGQSYDIVRKRYSRSLRTLRKFFDN
ncbi:MAG: RNA polymerase sigma factor [Clostridia bacterium]|nr:RNA polymerase sigma factor [Clostridia bacterium]